MRLLGRLQSMCVSIGSGHSHLGCHAQATGILKPSDRPTPPRPLTHPLICTLGPIHHPARRPSLLPHTPTPPHPHLPFLTGASQATACVVNAGLQIKDVNKNKQVSDLKSQKPPKLQGKSKYELTMLPAITLADYADLASRTAVCAAAILGGGGHRRRLAQDADVNTTVMDGAFLDTAQDGIGSSGANDSNTGDSSDKGGDIGSLGIGNSSTTDGAAAPLSRFAMQARTSNTMIGRARAVRLESLNTPSVLTIPLACQPLVDYMMIKMDLLVRTLVPLVVAQVKPLLDLLEETTKIAQEAVGHVEELIKFDNWIVYLDPAWKAYNDAVAAGACDAACQTTVADLISSVHMLSNSAQNNRAPIDKLLDTIDSIGSWVSDLRPAFCKVAVDLQNFEFRKTSLYDELWLAIRYNKPPDKYPAYWAGLMAEIVSLQELGEVLPGLSDSLEADVDAAMTAAAATADAVKADLVNIRTTMTNSIKNLKKAGTTSAVQAALVIYNWQKAGAPILKSFDDRVKALLKLVPPVKKAFTYLKSQGELIKSWNDNSLLGGAGVIRYGR